MPHINRPIRNDIKYLSKRRKPVAPTIQRSDLNVSTAPATGPSASDSVRLSLARLQTQSPGPSFLPTPTARTQPVSSAGSTGLSLFPQKTQPTGSSQQAAPNVFPRPAAPIADSSAAFEAPDTSAVRELTRGTPMVRLNSRQSAIGTLIVTGSTTILWESVEGITGSESATNGSFEGQQIPTPGNRPLVTLTDGAGLIALRHVRLFRRALFFGPTNSELGVQLYGGPVILVPTPGDGLRNILLVSRVGYKLELRADPVPAVVDDHQLQKLFGFKISAALPPTFQGP